MFDLDTDGEDDESDFLMGGGVPAMWCGLERVPGANHVEAGEGSLAALCEARTMLTDRTKHARTKELLVRHLWERQGEA